MMLRSSEQHRCMRLHVVGLQVKFRQLERESFYRISDSACGCYVANDFELIASNDEDLHAVTYRVVLDQDFIWPQHALYLIDRYDLQVLKRGPTGFFRSHFSKELDQFLFSSRDLLSRRRVSSRFPCGGPNFVQAAVKDVQLFADLLNALQPWRLVCSSISNSF